jgi:hypothetical protein
VPGRPTAPRGSRLGPCRNSADQSPLAAAVTNGPSQPLPFRVIASSPLVSSIACLALPVEDTYRTDHRSQRSGWRSLLDLAGRSGDNTRGVLEVGWRPQWRSCQYDRSPIRTKPDSSGCRLRHLRHIPQHPPACPRCADTRACNSRKRGSGWMGSEAAQNAEPDAAKGRSGMRPLPRPSRHRYGALCGGSAARRLGTSPSPCVTGGPSRGWAHNPGDLGQPGRSPRTARQ